MRVISGQARGKKLFAPKGDYIRPTSDRVKEAIFSILSPRLNDSIFVDLFCGSGAMGIEALSRGSKKVYFFDNDKSSVLLTQRNLDHCGFSLGQYLLTLSDYQAALERLRNNGVKADVIYLDPPYEMGRQAEILSAINRLELLAEDGIVLLEYDESHAPILDGVIMACTDRRKYGNTGVLNL